MSIESTRTTTSGSFLAVDAEKQQSEADETFVWDFNLNDIDPSLIFDESLSDQQQTETEQKPIDEKRIEEFQPTFVEWLNNTVPNEEHTQPDQVPNAFSWAKNESTKTSDLLANVSFGGLSAIGGALGSLMKVVGACGPICAHALSSVASAGSSGLSVVAPGLGGLNTPGFNVDKNGNFRLSGNIDSLSHATGLPREALLSGKYSAQDVLTTFTLAFGEGMYHLFGFSLIECIIDGLIPTLKAA